GCWRSGGDIPAPLYCYFVTVESPIERIRRKSPPLRVRSSYCETATNQATSPLQRRLRTGFSPEGRPFALTLARPSVYVAALRPQGFLTGAFFFAFTLRLPNVRGDQDR